MANIRFFLSILSVALTSSAAVAAAPARPFSAEAYAAEGQRKAVVLLSANWGKKRYCGSRDAVRLQRFAFDKAGGAARADKAPADFVMQVDASVGLPPPERFIPYAWLIEPGEYHLSSFAIETLKSADGHDVAGKLNVARKQLIEGGKPVGGKFTAAAGEVVYLGHFFLKCDGDAEPSLLRFVASDERFTKYLEGVLGKFKPLEAARVIYRPFESDRYAQIPDKP